MNFGNQRQSDDNMGPLEKISENLDGIKFKKQYHGALVSDSKTGEPKFDNPEEFYDWYKKELKQPYPAGKWQFLYKKGKKEISCIKGRVSFGTYEIFAIKGFKMEDPERYQTAVGTINRIKELLD